ncbi:hypothetical protein HDF10_000016 [Edaphobacter lichenicola]|uniref:Uncharacterized protein n=1 Tax=Tunturiibacter lichenicola TaxID=2051959 RepID=A0A7W8J5S7_9BACT|nr:hypothetical protein [Edaphobacter lichenicola]
MSGGDAGEVTLTIAGLVTRIPHAKIVDLSKVPVPVRIDGLLGAEFLEQYVVKIDPALLVHRFRPFVNQFNLVFCRNKTRW